MGENPLTHAEGWKWGSITHEILIVDWPNSESRYLVDAAWGPNNLAIPMKLINGETIHGLNEYEVYKFVNEDLPVSDWMSKPIDSIKGWTLYRRIIKNGQPIQLPVNETEGYWSPLFHMLPISVPLIDFGMCKSWNRKRKEKGGKILIAEPFFSPAHKRVDHQYSAYHELAAFTGFLLWTKLIPNGAGARRSLMYRENPGEENPKAKVYTTGGKESKGSDEGRDVEWVEMKVGPLREFLKKNGNYKF